VDDDAAVGDLDVVAVDVAEALGVGVLDGFGAGPFSSAFATAALNAFRVGLIDLPFTFTVGVALTPC
jgi:hypothetical protein